MRIRPGRLLSVSIVVVWVVLVGTHISRSYTRPAGARVVELSSPARSTDPELTQRGVFYRGSRIGFIRERVAPREEGFRAEQTGELTLNLLGRERKMSLEGAAETDAAGALRAFQFRLATASGRSAFETTVEGTVEGETLELTISSSGSERKERRTLDESIMLPLNLYYSLAARGWTAGDTYRVRLFDPMTLSEGEALVEVKEPEIVRWGGREEEAFRLLTTFSGLTTTAWVNDGGEVLKEETPLGWTLLKEAPGSSLSASGAEASRAPDVLSLSAVPAVGFAGDADALAWSELTLHGFPREFAGLDGGRQRRTAEGVRVEREVPPFVGAETLSPEDRAAALASDAFVQADHPSILEKALELTEGLDTVEKARRLNQWVYDNVSKSPTLSVPSAVEVLEQRVGDCNEHTVLYTALARASGLPTRMATGLAYLSGQFYYHAWPEVFVGRWLAVDPTFGQFPADAMHLRLLTGGLEGQYEVLTLLGQGISIEIAETGAATR